MSTNISSEFDPFRIVMSFASDAKNADWFIQTFSGLKFDISFDGADTASHLNTIRVLSPRVLQAYENLSQEAKLAAANLATGKLLSYFQRVEKNPDFLKQYPQFCGLSDRMFKDFHKIGWGFQDDRLVTLDPEIREMFFPKNSQWDAFVTIRAEIDKAQNELMLIDPYCDRAFFGILESSSARPKTIRLLCREKAAALKAESQAFTAQNTQLSIELRKSMDFHDRFLIIDKSTCIHIGASINHAGSRAFMISAVEDAPNRDALIKSAYQAWDAGVAL